jgi:hypothetical protein
VAAARSFDPAKVEDEVGDEQLEGSISEILPQLEEGSGGVEVADGGIIFPGGLDQRLGEAGEGRSSPEAAEGALPSGTEILAGEELLGSDGTAVAQHLELGTAAPGLAEMLGIDAWRLDFVVLAELGGRFHVEQPRMGMFHRAIWVSTSSTEVQMAIASTAPVAISAGKTSSCPSKMRGLPRLVRATRVFESRPLP